MSQRYPSRTIAMVTHAEVIRAVLLHQRGLSPDAWQSIDVVPASIHEIEMSAPDVVEAALQAAAP